MPCTAAKFVQTARAEIGYTETPVNRTKYGKWYGLDGEPWCDMFVSWVAHKAGCLEDIGGKHAYTPAHASWFMNRDQWGSAPRTGAIVFFDFPGGPDRISHVGIVESVTRQGGKVVAITTIEGNTQPGNTGDQRNGGGVYRRARPVRDVVGYGYPKFTPESTTRYVRCNTTHGARAFPSWLAPITGKWVAGKRYKLTPGKVGNWRKLIKEDGREAWAYASKLDL